MKKLSKLLTQRQALLRETRLANLAFAYVTLMAFRQRMARAGIRGRLMLSQAMPDAERYWATITALDGPQSVIDEHFADEDLMDFADVMAFVTGIKAPDFTFKVDELDENVLAVRSELEAEGILIDSSDARRDALR